MSQNDEPAREQSSRQKRDIQLFALEPRFLRKSILLVLIGVLIFQVVTWSFSLLAGFLFNLLLAWLLAISIDPIVTGLANRGMRRGLATTIVVVSGIALIGGFIAPLWWRTRNANCGTSCCDARLDFGPGSVAQLNL